MKKETIDNLIDIARNLYDREPLNENQIKLINDVFPDQNQANAFLNFTFTDRGLSMLQEFVARGEDRLKLIPDASGNYDMDLPLNVYQELEKYSQEALFIVQAHKALKRVKHYKNNTLPKRIALALLGIKTSELASEQLDSAAIKQAADENRKLLLIKYDKDGEAAKELPKTIGLIQAALVEAGKVLGFK